MIIDFRLNVFLTVARTLSFTKSAAMLNVSQPAISKHIKELEGDIGFPLFVRGGNRIALSDKARDIIPMVQSVIDSYHALNEGITKDSSSFEGTLNIGASTTISQYVLPSILAKFNKRYPKIRLCIRSANSDDVIELLQSGEVEIALIEDGGQNSAVHYQHLAYDTLVLVSATPHKTQLKISDLTSLPMIIREDGSGTLSVILKSLKGVGVSRKSLNIKMQLGSSLAIIGYLKESRDYAFISIKVAQELIDKGALHIIKVDGLEIKREFRFASLHGHSGRITTLFEEFCMGLL